MVVLGGDEDIAIIPLKSNRSDLEQFFRVGKKRGRAARVPEQHRFAALENALAMDRPCSVPLKPVILSPNSMPACVPPELVPNRITFGNAFRSKVLAEIRQAPGNLKVFQQALPCVRVDTPRTPVEFPLGYS